MVRESGQLYTGFTSGLSAGFSVLTSGSWLRAAWAAWVSLYSVIFLSPSGGSSDLDSLSGVVEEFAA